MGDVIIWEWALGYTRWSFIKQQYPSPYAPVVHQQPTHRALFGSEPGEAVSVPWQGTYFRTQLAPHTSAPPQQPRPPPQQAPPQQPPHPPHLPCPLPQPSRGMQAQLRACGGGGMQHARAPSLSSKPQQPAPHSQRLQPQSQSRGQQAQQAALQDSSSFDCSQDAEWDALLAAASEEELRLS